MNKIIKILQSLKLLLTTFCKFFDWSKRKKIEKFEKQLDNELKHGDMTSLLEASKNMNNIKSCLLISFIITLAGCNTINVYQTQSYEGRYSSKDKIEINGKPIKIDDKDPLWIMRASSLKQIIEAGK